MFLGHYIRKIDKSNRIIVPEAFLPDGLNTFIINRSVSTSLTIQTTDDFRIITGKLSLLDIQLQKNRDYVRYFFRGATELTIDNKSRLTIPAPLLGYMQAEQEVFLIGLINRIEVWAPKIFNRAKPGFKYSNDSLYFPNEQSDYTKESFHELCNNLRMGHKTDLKPNNYE